MTVEHGSHAPAEASVSSIPTTAPAPKQYDAVLVHSYWQSENPHREGGHVGSLRTRLATRAASHLAPETDNIVFLGGRLRGPSYPSTAELSQKEIVEKYGVAAEKVIAQPVGYGTEEEAVEFRKIAKEKGWKNVAVVAFDTHYSSVGRFLPQGESEGIKVTHRSVEDVIREKDKPHVVHLVERLKKSPYELRFKAYELAKSVVMSLPGGKDKMYAANKSARISQDDNKFNFLIAKALDVFRPSLKPAWVRELARECRALYNKLFPFVWKEKKQAEPDA